jgi:hypothetical protein
MADQETVRGDIARPNGSPEGVVSGIAEFGNDVATLAELQAKLAAIDFRESAARATVPLVLTLTGLVVAVAGVPVLLAGVAVLLASALSVSLGWMLVLVAAAAIVAAGATAAIAGRQFSHSFDTFRRSREELIRNLNWLRTVLVHSGRSVPRRR